MLARAFVLWVKENWFNLNLDLKQNTSKKISETLCQSKKDTEALLILNGVVLLQDFYQKFNFNIEYEEINEKVRESNVVGRRLEYLKIFK